MTKLARADQWISSGPVRYRHLGPMQNPVGIELGVDFAKAPVPEHFYVADYLFVEEDQSQILLTFGKLDRPATDTLRSKLEVYFSPVMFVKQLWASSREFHGRVKKYVEERGLRPPRWDKLLAAPKAQTFQSNQVMMLLSEGESLLDFFYISPKDIYYRPRLAEKLELEPLVRVILVPELLASFLEGCQPVAEKLLPKYGDKDENLESA